MALIRSAARSRARRRLRPVPAMQSSSVLRAGILGALILCASLSGPETAQAATISASTIISAENSFPGETVFVERGGDSPTVVQMIDGGAAQQLQLYDDSILNMQGGAVSHAVLAFGSSVVNVDAGSMFRLSLRQNASSNLFGGRIEGEISMVPYLGGIPTLKMFGGVAHDLSVPGSSVASIHGGRLDWLRVNNGLVNMTGGSILNMILNGHAVVRWSGGELREGFLWMQGDAILHVYGRGLYLDEDSQLFGTLLDGTVIENEWVDLNDRSRVVLHNVPEPSSASIAWTLFALLLTPRLQAQSTP